MLGIALALMKEYNPFDDPLFMVMLPAVHYCCRVVSAAIAWIFHMYMWWEWETERRGRRDL